MTKNGCQYFVLCKDELEFDRCLNDTRSGQLLRWACTSRLIGEQNANLGDNLFHLRPVILGCKVLSASIALGPLMCLVIVASIPYADNYNGHGQLPA